MAITKRDRVNVNEKPTVPCCNGLKQKLTTILFRILKKFNVIIIRRGSTIDISNNYYIVKKADSINSLIESKSNKKNACYDFEKTMSQIHTSYINYLNITGLESSDIIKKKLLLYRNTSQYAQVDYNSLYIYIFWEKNRPDAQLFNLMRSMCCSENKKIEYTGIWLRYLSSLAEMGYITDFVNVMHQYLQFANVDEIASYIPVAKYAYDYINLSNDKIVRSKQLFDHMENSRIIFEKEITGKTIAIVGNSSLGLKSGMGEIIDSFDLVARFNTFQISGFTKDFGTKTNIWIRNKDIKAEDVMRKIDYKQFDLILFEIDIWRFRIEESVLDDICRYVESRVPFTYILGRDELVNKLDIFPTSGLLIANYLYKLKRNVKQVRLFNYSANYSTNSKTYSHYFESDVNAGSTVHHNIDIEIDYLKKNNMLCFINEDDQTD